MHLRQVTTKDKELEYRQIPSATIERLELKQLSIMEMLKNLTGEVMEIKNGIVNVSVGQTQEIIRAERQHIQRGVHDIKQVLSGNVIRFPNASYGDEGPNNFFIQGHVEIIHQGQWGTICDDYFTNAAADTLCRMDGYRRGTYDAGRYKQASATKVSRIWLDDVVCRGEETDIDDCQHNPWGISNCSHDEDVGIRCYY